MRDFKSVIKEIKVYLADGKEFKVLDKDVADALNISQAKFATIKKRNSMPYDSLLLYCKNKNISPIELFFE